MPEIKVAVKTILKAGQALMKEKSDMAGKSAQTKKCEEVSYCVLKEGLTATRLPLLSKFDALPYDERKVWEQFWMVAPLLGGKSFRAGRNDYLISVTKIMGNRPVSAVLLSPERDALCIAIGNHKAYKVKGLDPNSRVNVGQLLNESNQLDTTSDDFFLRILKDKPVMNRKTERFIQRLVNHTSGAFREEIDGSPTNLLGIAEGKYHVYPHLSTVAEWDLAAFDALIHACGYMVTQADGIMPLQYNSRSLKFNSFIAKTNFEFDTLAI